MGGNPLARIGVVVLFFGVASALRLAGTVAAGLAMVVTGLRLPGGGQRRMLALAVQGGGFALLYLAVYFALARYGFIGVGPAFTLFTTLGVACAALSSVRVLRETGCADTAGAPWLPAALTLWLAGWWLFGGLADIDGFAPSGLQPALVLLFGIVSAACAEQQGRAREFAVARGLAALSRPLLWAGSMLAWDTQPHLLAGPMTIVLPLAWATHYWMLRRQDEDGAPLLNGARHVASAWMLLVSAGIEANGWLAQWLPGQTLWPWLGWIAVCLFAVRWLYGRTGNDDDEAAWPWSPHRDAFRQRVLMPAAGLLLLFTCALQLGHDGGSAIRYLPLASALDLASIAALFWLAKSRLLPLPAVGAAGLLWVSALAARGVHHLAGVAWSTAAMFQSTLLQAALSLTWTLAALALMIHATRSGARALWFAGFALLAAVGAKLLMIDLASAGTVEWTASLLGIGALILIAGHVAPVPPNAAPTGDTP